MRRLSALMLFVLLSLALFAATATAEQVKFEGVEPNDSNVEYFFNSTTKVGSESDKLERLNQDPTNGGNKFKPDGKTNYPWEIFLPNEETPGDYRIHTNYTRDTDACASCHATHTAVGMALLQWYSVYETCMACHDGTVTTTYNVQDGWIGAPDGQRTFGGKFGIGEGNMLSNHNVTGAVMIGAAPGGSMVKQKIGDDIVAWELEFGCQSCHSPHGQGGNARILHPDPNGMARLNNSKSNEKLTWDNDEGGYIYKTASGAGSYKPVTWIKGYPYDDYIVVKDNISGSAEITQLEYTVDNSKGYTVLKFTDGDNVKDGKVYKDTGFQNVAEITASFVYSYRVEMEVKNYLRAKNSEGTAQAEEVNYLWGINDYCGACHWDYNTANDSFQWWTSDNTKTLFYDQQYSYTGSGGMLAFYKDKSDRMTGKYSKAYRHQVGMIWRENEEGLKFEQDPKGGSEGTARSGSAPKNIVVCLTCHVAHGTDQQYWADTLQWKDSSDVTLAAKDYVEFVGSSALKRMPNMGTCEACHKKGDAQQGYKANAGQTGTTNSTKDDATTTDALFATKAGKLFISSIGDSTGAICAKCHKTQVANYRNSKHFDVDFKKVVGDKEYFACEVCHDYMGNHLKYPASPKNVVRPATKDFSDQIKDCGVVGCHVDQKTAFVGTNMESSGVVSCNTCHNVMNNKADDTHLKLPKTALCSGCHGSDTKDIINNVPHAFDVPSP